MLAPSGPGTRSGTTKALAVLGCNADPARARRRRHEGGRFDAEGSDLHGIAVPNGGRHPGFRGSRYPSRGGGGMGASADSMRTMGVTSPSNEGSANEQGCSRSFKGPAGKNRWVRRGISIHAGLRQQAVLGRSFTRGFSARAVQRCRPASRRRKRWLGRGVARKRRHDGGGGFRGEALRRACRRRGVRFERTVAARGLRHAPSRGGAHCSLNKGGASEGGHRGQWQR
jgi:hypothetical protein